MRTSKWFSIFAFGITIFSASVIAHAQVVAYTGFNLTGQSRAYSRSTADLGSFGPRIRSIRVMPGYRVSIFRERNYRGTQSNITENWSMPTGSPWRGTIRSMRIERNDTPAPPTSGDFPVIYAQPNYNGAAMAVERDWAGDRTWEGNPHRIRSIRVPAGWRLTLFRERNFRGTQTVITDSISWDSPGQVWNGATRSIRVERTAVPPIGVLPPVSGDPTIYAQTNFSGPAMALVRDWPRLGDWDGSPHHIRSIRVPQGRPIMIYSGRNYTGRSYLVTSDWTPQPGDYWYGRIRSIKINVPPQPR
jgi:hypothetical protein